MHISDGYLPASTCIGGYALTGLVTWYSLRQIKREKDPTESIPKASLLAAAFFASSSLTIPLPPSSVHPLLNGLLGIVLGYYAFPAILAGLFFQAAMLSHGGLTTLGINALTAGVPALLAHYLFQLSRPLRLRNLWLTSAISFIGGAGGVAITVLMLFGLLIANIPADIDAGVERSTIISTLVIAHITLMLLEGAFTATAVSFLQKTKPELLPKFQKKCSSSLEQ
jgi:cobalt/nickel transport system permease protein